MQGGSSITQQLAKNLFLINERTIERKVKEAFLAIWLETRLTKNEILKLYLDRAYLGGGAFGVDAAAQYLFQQVGARREPRRKPRCSPACSRRRRKFAPHINLPAARARANVVLDNLVEAGFMTEGQVFGARRNPAIAVDRRDERSPNYYLDWAFDEMKKLVDTLPEVDDRARVRGAHRARHRPAARRRERRSRTRCASTAANITRSQAAAVMADHDGAVRAMVGGRDYGAEPVQPRDRRAAPARLLVQALRLCRRADERHSSRPRSWSMARSASATGARRTTAAAIPAR